MTLNYPRDEEDSKKDCGCGHSKKSHLTVNQTPAGPAYLYKKCLKSKCDCSGFENSKDRESEQGENQQ